MEEVVSRDVYDLVLLVATLPTLAFVIWLSWIITNRIMSREWQQRRRAQQIRKAVAERAALMAELHAESPRLPRDDKHPMG